MVIRDLLKKVLSTGVASIVEKAKGLYASGDLEGAVKCLEEALEIREVSGKPRAVIAEYFERYSEELHLKRLNEHRDTLAGAAFDTGNFSRIEAIMASIVRGIKESVYQGKLRAKADALYKEYLGPFQELQKQIQKDKIDQLSTLSPEVDADKFVILVEDLRRMGGRLPEELHSACKTAEERSYILLDDLREFANLVIERKLGSGGFASVFLASSKGIGFRSAIKIFAPHPTLVQESGLSLAELKDRFKQEALIMLHLSKEKTRGIVNARHSDSYLGKPYLLMDYYPGSLSDLIGGDEDLLQGGQGKLLGYEESLPVIQEILKSIHSLHNRPSPIIHRDLKPTNILLDEHNMPHIADFGLAREVSRLNLLSRAFQTSTGANLGSQFYGAPEQRQGGFKEADQRADIYSLGVIIYRILTGRLIGFHDREPLENHVKDLNGDKAERLNDLLAQATRLEPNKRLSDVSILLELFSGKPSADAQEKASTLVRNTGRLSVSSVPKGAAIWLDGRDTGQETNAILEVTSGNHSVLLKKKDYREAGKDVELNPEKLLEIELRLNKEILPFLPLSHQASDKGGSKDRYEVIGNDIVKDNKAGLEWIAGPDKDTNWNEAKEWVKNLKVDGGGWRMPTVDELEGLYEKDLGERNMTPFLKTNGRWVWSDETDNSSSTRIFYFSSGGRNWHRHKFAVDGRAFAVRSLGG